MAGIIDLKTTEIPDEIPYVMMGIGVVGNLGKSLILGSYTPVLLSILVGLVFLGFGFLLYYTGQWGGGDAKILSGIGFLLPQIGLNKSFFPFPVGFFFNVFFVGAFYMIGYILVASFIHKGVWKEFGNDLKGKVKDLVLLNISLVGFLVVLGMFSIHYWRIAEVYEILRFGGIVIFVSVGMFFLWRFGKAAEKSGFKKRIKVSKLKEGDVLEESKLWEGLTKGEVKKIKKSKRKYVTIKEGVRFAPTFFLALLVTLLVGDLVFWVIGLIQ